MSLQHCCLDQHVSVIIGFQKTLGPYDPGIGMCTPGTGYGTEPVTGGSGL